VRLRAALSEVDRNHRSEMAHPIPNGLVRHRHSALRQQILDVTQAEAEPEGKPYRLVNEFGRQSIAAIADLVQTGELADREPRKPRAP